MGGLMFEAGSFTVNTVLSCLVVIVFHLVWNHVSEKRRKARRTTAEKFAEDLQQLCSFDTAVVSISRSEEGPVTLSVIDEWTEYTETCFIQASMENAVEEALAYKNSRKR